MVAATTTRRSNRVRKPTSRSSSRVSSPALPGTKAKVRGRTTTQSDDQQSKDTDETNSGHASALDQAMSSSSSSSSSDDEDEDKSKHSQGTVPRRQPRRSKRARLYPTPDEPSQSEEKMDQETMGKKEKSKGDESSASSSSERKKTEVKNDDNDVDDDDDSSDNEPLSILVKRKKEKLKNMATLETSSKDSTEGNDHSREVPPKKPLNSAASSIVDEDEDDKESGDDPVKPPTDSKTRQRRKRQNTTTATTMDTSHRSSGDEHDANGPPLKKKRGRNIQSSKKSVSDPSTNDELSSDESVVKGGKRSTRSRRRKENAASRPLPSTIQEQEENDDDHDNSKILEERKVAEEKEESNDNTKTVDSDSIHDDESKRGKHIPKANERHDSVPIVTLTMKLAKKWPGRWSHLGDLNGKEGNRENLEGGESLDDDHMVIKEQTATETETAKEEDSQEDTSEPQQMDVGQEKDASNVEPSRQVEHADVDTKTNNLDTEDGIEEQSSVRESYQGATEQQADDKNQIEASDTAETTAINRDNIGNGVTDLDHVMDTTETSENTNNSIEKDTQIESVPAMTVEAQCEDSQGTKSMPDQSSSDTATEINPTSESTFNAERSGADLSTQTDTLSDVANADSSQQHEKTSLDESETDDRDNKQGLDHNLEAPCVLPTASISSIGEHHQIASHESSPIQSDVQLQPAKGETTPVLQQLDDEGRQSLNATVSIGEGQLQSTDVLTSKMEKSGQTQETAVQAEKDLLIVTSNDHDPNPEIRNQADIESMNQSTNSKSLRNENSGAELEASSLRNAEENEHMNEGETVDLPDDSKSRAETDKNMDIRVTGVSPSEKQLDENEPPITGDDRAELNDEATEEVKVGPLRRDEVIEPTAENEEQTINTSKKDEDEENDHFHDAQMELPPEPHQSLNRDHTKGETTDKIVSQGQQTVEESLEEQSEPTAQITTRTDNETLDEDRQLSHSNPSILEASAITEGSPKEQHVDELSTPIITAEVPHANLEFGAVVNSPSPRLDASSLDNTNSVVGNNFHTIPDKELINTGPQTPETMPSQGTAGSQDNCVIASDNGMEISIIPTNEPAQMNEGPLGAQEDAMRTSVPLLQPKPSNTAVEGVTEELKKEEEATPTENIAKGTSTAATASSDHDMALASVTDPQASDEMKADTSKPPASSDSNEPQILPKMHGMDASASVASPASLIVDDVQIETDGCTSEAKVPAIQSPGTDGDPHSAHDAKKSPELWALPFDLDYKVKFGPSAPLVSKLPNKTRVIGVEGSDADKIKRVKAALYAAGSKAHRGSGFERIFAEYWDAMALHLSDRLSSHTSERCQKAIDNYLTTSKLRKLHNRFVMSILRRATKSMTLYDEISSHLPPKWRNRISIICDKPSELLSS